MRPGNIAPSSRGGGPDITHVRASRREWLQAVIPTVSGTGSGGALSAERATNAPRGLRVAATAPTVGAGGDQSQPWQDPRRMKTRRTIIRYLRLSN